MDDDPRTKHLREIAPQGQRALIEQIRRLRNSWPTDDFLAILNADLPDMTDDASIETWVNQAEYRFAGTVEVLSRFGKVPVPPRWIYGVPGAGFVLGPLVFTHTLATRVAQTLIAEQPQPTFQNAAKDLTTMERELTHRHGAGLDMFTRVAFHDVLVVCRAAIARLETVPARWSTRLRRCPGPKCRAPYFWNAHTRPDEGIYCSEACEKALKRRKPP